MIKSPFYIVQDFISPLLCEQMVDGLQFVEPNTDVDNNPVLTSKTHDKFEEVIYKYLRNQMPDIEQYYNIEYRGMKQVEFKWYPQECVGDPEIVCENSVYSEKKKVWIRNKDRDLTGIIFLSDYNSKVPFDSEYEVCGGKYEFPQHSFGFQAERGTMILYPSVPHFLNKVCPIQFGDLFIAKFHIATKLPFLYNPTEYEGDFIKWFEKIS